VLHSHSSAVAATATAAFHSLQGFQLHYAVNFLAHFALTQHLLPSLLEQRACMIVVSSILHT
jgi:NAD(P)-dependent dehydrogenase (short-subunit alcohol dehydrogenase family)